MSLAELQALERDHVMPTYARQPVEFVRGEGTRLWDADGNEYLDFLTGISVVQIGHCHPALVEAISEQAARLIAVGNLFYNEPAMRLAERLADRSLGGKVFFTNSGAEAIECAIKLARKRRRGGEIVVLSGAFHGRTMGALSATPQEAKQQPFAPLVPGFRVVPRENPALGEIVSERTAAVLIEPVQGESGIWPVPPDVLREARQVCDETGALLIFDEIQCGMGRTGSLWAFEQAGVTPDAMTVAKGLGGGLPIGACIAGPENADVFDPGDHGSTFAGSPLVAAAANAVLDVVDDEEFLAGVRRKGELLRSGLTDLGLDVRGAGLMLAFRQPDGPDFVRRALLEERLILNAPAPDAVRLLPPLTVSDDEIAEALRRIDRPLGSAPP
ncbi:MAG: acetylornithine/N-succinyldiaminopimelate aminotransferase [Thermoleophilaceae bacterium]|nr:acetylornithine/N-succinyldiaminopimelate aminotransferase [Thermoleophilaceae bacterium]